MTKITIRKNQQMNLLIEQLKKTPIIQIACEKVGVSRATYYRWCKSNKKFQQGADQALEDGKKLINDMAESQLIAGIKNQNMTAIIYWLKHNHASYKNTLELSGSIKSDNTKLTPQQEKVIKNALKLTSTLNLQDNETN